MNRRLGLREYLGQIATLCSEFGSRPEGKPKRVIVARCVADKIYSDPCGVVLGYALEINGQFSAGLILALGVES